MHNIHADKGGVVKFETTPEGLTTGYQDFKGTIIDLQYMRKYNACLSDQVILKLEPKIREGCPLTNILYHDNLIVNHRAWIIWVSIHYTIRYNAIQRLTRTYQYMPADGFYTSFVHYILYEIAREYDHYHYLDSRLPAEHDSYQLAISRHASVTHRIFEETFNQLHELLIHGIEATF